MIKVSDFMSKDIATVTPDTPISIAIRVLIIKKVTGLPVIDSDGKLGGVITEKDCMSILLNDKDIKDKTVADYMTKNVMVFSPDDSAESVCEALIKNNFRRVPVVKDGKLVGLVSRRDIIALIWKEKFEKKC